MAERSDLNLAEVEADIRKCEEFLRANSFTATTSGTAVSVEPASGNNGADSQQAEEMAVTPTSASASRQLSEDRRKEILDRLLTERQQRRLGEEGSFAESHESVADRHERVQQLLEQRRQASGQQKTTASGRELFMSPESSIGTIASEARYPQQQPGAAASQHSRPSHPAALDQFGSGAQLYVIPDAAGALGPLDLGGSRGGPIEVDPSVLYTPPSTALSVDDDRSTGGEVDMPARASQRSPPSAGRGGTAGPSTSGQQQRQQQHHSTQDDARFGTRGGNIPSTSTPAGAGEAGGGADNARARARPSSAPKERPALRSTVIQEFNLSRGASRYAKHSVMERVQAERDADLTFRPKLIAQRRGGGGGGGGAANGAPASAPHANLTGAARMEQLAQPRVALWQKCAQQKLAEGSQEMKDCTFKPRTGRGPASGIPAQVARLPAPERLYMRHDNKYATWERLKIEQDQAELAECTFRPRTARPDRHLRQYVPLPERVPELQRAKSERLARQGISAEAGDPDMTFTPAINDKSVRLAIAKEVRERRDELPVAERLAHAEQQRTIRRMRNEQDLAEKEADCTFAPRTNEASGRLLEDSLVVPNDFEERQRWWGKARESKLRKLQAQTADERECTFRPFTGNAAEVLARTGNPAAFESYLDKVERLSFKDKQRVEAVRAAAQQHYYGQFSFRPHINPRSAKMAKANPLSELVSNERIRKAREAAAAAAEEEFQRQHTFRPQLAQQQRLTQPQREGRRGAASAPASPRRSRSRSPGGEEWVPSAKFAITAAEPRQLTKCIAAYRAGREAKLEETRCLREYEELLECTFSPAINPAPPEPPQKPIVVRGLARYLELKELAKQQEAERKAREEKAFILRPSGSSNQITVPKPFNLAGPAAVARMEDERRRLREKLMAEAMAECTFAPRTNEARNRALIARILQEEDDEEAAEQQPDVAAVCA